MKILQIDIETAPHKALIWGPKQTWISPDSVVESGYTLCFAAKWYGKPGVDFYSVHHDGADTMVKAAWDLLNEADAVIHYNGTKFDIPTLNADFVTHRLGVPSPFHEIDLLKTVRQRFRKYSNKLDEVAKWLGVGNKVQHKGLGLWIDCMDGDEKAWKVMRRYNEMDVRLLERVYNELRDYIKSHPNHALYTDDTRPCCPTCGSRKIQKRGMAHTRTQSYQRFQCQDCGSWSRKRTTALAPDKREGVLVAA
jgi:hypothetical protein